MCANIKLDEENRKVYLENLKECCLQSSHFVCYDCVISCVPALQCYLPRLYSAGCKLSHQQKIFNSNVDSSDRLGVEPLSITQREQDLILTTNIQHIKICDITIQNYSRDIYNIKTSITLKGLWKKSQV